MIVTMKPEVDKKQLEPVVRRIVGLGYDVQIQNKNGENKFVLALLGLGAEKSLDIVLREVGGVEKCDPQNKYFNEHHHKFVEAWAFFGEWGY